jgi:hypothetical protein
MRASDMTVISWKSVQFGFGDTGDTQDAMQAFKIYKRIL